MNAAVQPNYDTVTGWAKNTASDLGGMRGKRIDQAIADIKAAGAEDLASFVPPFAMGRFWLPPDSYRQWVNYDAARFAPPTPEQLAELGFTGAQLAQILQSLQYQCNFLYGVAVGTGKAGQDIGGYRGEPNTPGFPTYTPTPIEVWGPDGKLVTVTIPPNVAAIRSSPFWNVRRMHVDSVIAGHEFWLPTGPERADHFLCDPWFDMRTDVNVARYIRSWARAYGVSIDAEPAT